MECSLPGSSVHGILQARILEWVAISFSRVSSQPRDQIQVSHIAGRRSTLDSLEKDKLGSFYCLFLVSISFICRRRQWHPTPVLLPGKFHGWRSLVDYSPWGRKESDTTERLHSLTHSIVINKLYFNKQLFCKKIKKRFLLVPKDR